MPKPTPQFTMKELLEEVLGSTVNDLDLEAMTTKEFMEVFGVGSPKTARNRIRPYVESEILIPIRVQRKNMAGFNSTVPAYAVNPAASWEDVEEVQQ